MGLPDIGFKSLEKLFLRGNTADVADPDGLRIYRDSMRTAPDGVRYLAISETEGETLLVYGKASGPNSVSTAFYGAARNEEGNRILAAPVDTRNIRALLEVFPDLAPTAVGRKRSSFGLGDRLGMASPGHIRLFSGDDMVPVLAQQSLRELDLMGRRYQDVIDAAIWAVFSTGYRGPWIADGDHLKEVDAVVSALEQGCTMITADLSDHLDFAYMEAEIPLVVNAYSKLDSGLKNALEGRYQGDIQLRSGTVLRFNPEIRQRLALTYGKAISHAEKLYHACRSVRTDFDFEISIDETDLPTTPEAHYFVAKELTAREIEFTSMAPRYIGEFQKGIDYIGDTENFTASFEKHAAIAGELGYKISIHSSSDKFSVYPIIGRLVKGAYHLKTSGTNWLVALETIAAAEPEFFRKLFNKAYEVFPVARTYYHITPDMDIATELSAITDEKLVDVFTNSTDRQVMHVSYGELFKDRELKNHFFSVLRTNISAYWNALEKHIGRHLLLLNG